VTLVSIVTPSFQQAAYLERTIQSVIEQDHREIEYAVVDGGSTDGSVEIIRRYAGRLAWWVSEPDHGQTHAIRKGWDRATGEVLAYLNADDVYLPGAVGRAVGAFDDDPAAAIVFGRCERLDETTGGLTELDAGPADLVSVLTRRVLIPQPSAFIRAGAALAVGGPDETLHYAMDFDLWIRALLHGPARFVEGPALARYRWHPAAKSSRADETFARELTSVLDRFYRLPGLPADARAVRGRAYAEADLAGARAALRLRGDLRNAGKWLLRAARHDPAALRDALARRIA
jgi:glycosyltransferase involved in cell wall biosynthesis